MSSSSQHQQQLSHHHHDDLLNAICKISLLLGFVIGWLSQMATFALNFMAIHLARVEQVTHDNKKDDDFMIEWCLILSAALVTTSIGTVGLLYVRNLLRKYITVTTSCTVNTSDSSNSNSNGLVELLMDHVDNRLVVGSLLGVGMVLLWDILIMGQQMNLYHFTLIIFLLFFQLEGSRMPSTLLLQEEEGEAKKKQEQFQYIALV